MMKLVICFILSIWSYSILQAQELKVQRWSFCLTGGYQRAIHNWQTGSHVDGLLIPQDNLLGVDWRINYYISSFWGVHAGLGGSFGLKSVLKSDRIPDQISAVYKDQFYIQNPNRKKWENSKAKFYFGVQTRLKKQKWIVVPRVSLAFSRIGAEKCNFLLKGKGTNALYEVEYMLKEDVVSQAPLRIGLNPAILLGYKLPKVYLVFEIDYTQYFKKITYVVNTLDLYKGGQLTVNEYKSRHLANALQFNIGCCIPL